MITLELATEAITAFAEVFQIDLKKLGVISGGALLFHGIRYLTNDIDFQVDQETFDLLYGCPEFRVLEKSVPDINGELEPGRILILSLEMENGETVEFEIAHAKWTGYRFINIQGFSIQHPESVLDMKRIFNRPNDQEDIRALTELVDRAGNNSSHGDMMMRFSW